MTHTEMLHEFVDYLCRCQLSEKSIDTYRADAEAFLGYLDKTELPFTQTNLEHLLRWVSFLRAQSDSDNTIGRRISAIRRLYAYACYIGVISSNPALGLKTVRRHNPIPRMPGLQLAKTVLRSVEASTETVRDNTVVVLAALAGLRVSEIVGLRLRSFQVTTEGLLVAIPGSGKRTVHLRGPCGECVQQHWALRCATTPDTNSHFLLGRKRGPMSRQGVWKILKRRSVQLGLPQTVGPSQLRGLFIHHLLAQDASLQAKAFAAGIKAPNGLRLYTYDDPGIRSGGPASRVSQSRKETQAAYAAL